MSQQTRAASESAETSVLGSILLDNTCIHDVSQVLSPEHFSSDAAKLVYKTALFLSERGDPIDPVTIAQVLDGQGALDSVGGINGLLTLNEASASAVNVLHHARIMVDIDKRRRALLEMDRKRTLIEASEPGSIDAAIALTMDALSGLCDESQSSTGLQHHAGALKGAVRDAQEANERGGQLGVSCDLDALNQAMGGTAGRGHLITVAGRPGMGKSAVAMQWAVQVACPAPAPLGQQQREGEPVAIFSLEMPAKQCSARNLCAHAQVPHDNMKNGTLSDSHVDRLLTSMRLLSKAPIYIDQKPAATIGYIRGELRRLVSKVGPLGGVVIDYVQRMGGKSDPRERVVEITRTAKTLALIFDCPILLLAQLNRECEKRQDKRPMLSDLKESGSIEEDSDVVLFVYRDEYYNEDSEDRGIAEVIAAKNRSGSTGTWKMRWSGPCTRFDDIRGGY